MSEAAISATAAPAASPAKDAPPDPVAVRALERDLREAIEGEVRFDSISRYLYSTDASLYQIMPAGVVVPKSTDDVIKTVNLCRSRGVSITPRGGGTSLAGQSVGPGIQIDFSKYLNRVIEFNAQERWVRVQPGVVLDNLNDFLLPHGLQFAPDVATSSRANIGGMIGNNSSGAHSILYGKTIDHVLELDVVLSDGSVTHLGPMDTAALERKCDLESLEGGIYREVLALAMKHADEIDRRYPKILRRVGGYNLDSFTDLTRPINLSRMVVGSEGTLALTLEAKLNLVPTPGAKALCMVEFEELLESLEAVVPILEHAPAAVELIDKLILDQTRGSLELEPVRAVLKGDPGAVLIVEFYGHDPAEAAGKLDGLVRDLREKKIGYAYTAATDPAEQKRVWELRKSGLGLLMSMRGDAKPYAFVEDTAVSPEKLPAYIRRFRRIIEAHDTYAGYYAHASVGCLHVRPLVDLKTLKGVEKFRSIAEQVSDLVLEFGGAMSAEHGDGLVRSCWTEKMFGPVLYEAFREVKRIFDPDGLFNPGKIVDAPDMTDNLRIKPRSAMPRVESRFDFSAEGGFYRAIEMCSGVGECRKTLSGTMCPSYMATRDEIHSTRGRANALRAALDGDFQNGLTDKRLHEVLDLCLECKACKSECPSGVDMAKLKYEFLDKYQKAHGIPRRNRFFAHADVIGRIGSRIAPLANVLAASRPVRWLNEKLLGISAKRIPPPFAEVTFPDLFARRSPGPAAGSRGEVILFNDTFMNYHEPAVGLAAADVLDAAGYAPRLAPVVCCGRPAISKGMLDRAVELASRNVAALFPFARAGVRIVGTEPSCLLTLRDEYPELLTGKLREMARTVAGASVLIEELLVDPLGPGMAALPLRGHAGKVMLHGHCHQKALVGLGPTEQMLKAVRGVELETIDSGCCGMAGAFGYEVEHYEVSRACAERRLAPAVRAADESTVIVAPGTSCRAQIEHFTGRRALHPAEFIAGQLAV